MKNQELKNVRGSIDYGGKDAIIRSFISKTLQGTFEKYGYSPLETSILCYYDLLALKYDDDNDILKEIYKVSDQGNRNLALRYDLTVPFAKYIASNKDIKLPFKRYEIGKVFRDGPIKKGRTREFIQCDVDTVGIEGQMIEAELISIFVEGYKKLGIDIVIKYNNRKLMNGIIEICDVESNKVNQVITIIDKMEKLTKEELIEELKKQQLKEEQIDKMIKYLTMEFNNLNKLFKDTTNINLKEGLDEIKELKKYIKELELTEYVTFSATLARGQEYYTGTIFEVYVADGSIKSSIGGGGRYDNMIGEFINDGKKYPAVGVSFGLDVIFEILTDKTKNINSIDIYIIPMNNNITALKLANELRQKNIKVEVEMNNLKLKKALSSANETEIPLVIILGEDELKENKLIIKDMRNNFQITENIDNLINTIQELISIPKIEYKILNPGGNKTALVKSTKFNDKQKCLINRLIMEKYLEVEQVGFLSNETNRLEMAGGEFCMNATRCAIYEYSKENEDSIEISVSGTNNSLKGRVLNDNKVEIKIDISKNIDELIEVQNDFILVKIDGILIVIFDEEKSKEYIRKLKDNEELAKKELKEFMNKNIQTTEKAIGIMLLENVLDKIKINPVVWVKDIDTVFYETACGSGSLATAIYNYYNCKEEMLEIIQPSGYTVNIELDTKKQLIENAIITGIVEEV